MTPASLIGPIAAAAMVNVFHFALMWRGHQAERSSGQAPWWMLLGIVIYGSGAAAFFYLRGDALIQGGFDAFGAAVGAEMLGAVVVYGLLHAFLFSRSKPMRERAFPMLIAIVLIVGVFASLISRP